MAKVKRNNLVNRIVAPAIIGVWAAAMGQVVLPAAQVQAEVIRSAPDGFETYQLHPGVVKRFDLPDGNRAILRGGHDRQLGVGPAMDDGAMVPIMPCVSEFTVAPDGNVNTYKLCPGDSKETHTPNGEVIYMNQRYADGMRQTNYSPDTGDTHVVTHPDGGAPSTIIIRRDGTVQLVGADDLGNTACADANAAAASAPDFTVTGSCSGALVDAGRGLALVSGNIAQIIVQTGAVKPGGAFDKPTAQAFDALFLIDSMQRKLTAPAIDALCVPPRREAQPALAVRIEKARQSWEDAQEILAQAQGKNAECGGAKTGEQDVAASVEATGNVKTSMSFVACVQDIKGIRLALASVLAEWKLADRTQGSVSITDRKGKDFPSMSPGEFQEKLDDTHNVLEAFSTSSRRYAICSAPDRKTHVARYMGEFNRITVFPGNVP